MKNSLVALSLAVVAAAFTPAYAEDGLPAPTAEEQAARAKFTAATIDGPSNIDLKHEATLSLPGELRFLKSEQAAVTLRAMGNDIDDRLVGLIWPKQKDAQGQWFVVLEYENAGYVSDVESGKLDPDAILAGMRQSAADANDKRKLLGTPTLDVVGWIEPPHYDLATHDLIWSIEAREIDSAGKAEPQSVVNYSTRVLGRDGYLSLNLVGSREEIEATKPVIGELLTNLHFDQGKRYEDYNAKTDKTAEYGLIALIGGVAAHKLGFFAVIAAFAAKFVKVWLIAAAGGFAALRNVFRRRKGP